jgi:thiol-disulfide isomerase/thioredoxin
MGRHGWVGLAAGLVIGLGAAAGAQEKPDAPATPKPAPTTQPETKAPETKPESKPETKQPEPGKPPEIVPLTPPGKSLVKIGDPAPELKVMTWVKGEPVKGYEKGKIYVVELWATWCKPCLDSIPGLTELQRSFKERGVRVVGVSIWENTPPHNIGDLPADASPDQINAAYLERVKTFVQGMGDKMDYAVAFDGIEGTTANWMFRLGQSGIPCAYVINREGKMAWVGHPRDVGSVVAELVSGTYDMSKSPDRVARDAAVARKIRDLNTRYQRAMNEGKPEEIVKVLGELVDLDPVRFQEEIPQKFRMMLVDLKDDKGAYAFARKMREGAAKDLAKPLNDMAWVIVDDDQVARRDYDEALALALRADEVSNHESAAVMDTLARAYFEKGEIDKAIETQTRAIEAAGKGEQDARAKGEMEAALRKYKSAKR